MLPTFIRSQTISKSYRTSNREMHLLFYQKRENISWWRCFNRVEIHNNGNIEEMMKNFDEYYSRTLKFSKSKQFILLKSSLVFLWTHTIILVSHPLPFKPHKFNDIIHLLYLAENDPLCVNLTAYGLF